MGQAGTLSAAVLAKVMISYRESLELHAPTLNRLNVFPVPDGDTGTNMALTVAAVVDELAQSGLIPVSGEGQGGQQGPELDLDKVADAVTRASLMGARGNSGVILSQLLGSLAQGWKAGAMSDDSPPQLLASALQAAAARAAEAVQHPAEGTILSVAREAAAAVAGAVDAGGDLMAAIIAGRDQAVASLALTPTKLPQLAAAKVVDSGAAGLLLLYDALAGVLCGLDPLGVVLPADVQWALDQGSGPVPKPKEQRNGLSDVGPRFEVMFMLEAPEEAVGALRDVWDSLGDSIVVVGHGEMWSCHIHTDDIGAAIEAGVDTGRLSRIRVADLSEQVEEERWVREGGENTEVPPAHHEPRETAVVAVAPSEALGKVLRSLGAAEVVIGGPAANASVAELLAAIEDAPAASVVVLTNDKNLIPAARQAGGASTKEVAVIATTEVVEGIAAICEYDPRAVLEANAQAMSEVAKSVLSGRVAQAHKDTSDGAVVVKSGQWVGLSGSSVLAVGEGPVEAACGLVKKLAASGDRELLTVIEGQPARPAHTRALLEWLAEQLPDLEVEVIRGGQPLYNYLLGLN